MLATRKPIILYLESVSFLSFLYICRALDLNLSAAMLLDPVWSKRASPFRFVGPQRVNDRGIAFADLPPIDVVLVSHGHYDNLDLATLSLLAAAHRARVITPLGNDTIIRNHDPAIASEGTT